MKVKQEESITIPDPCTLLNLRDLINKAIKKHGKDASVDGVTDLWTECSINYHYERPETAAEAAERVKREELW